jgi:murein DD-endopeptidase MepM/ murein hydrolase activator NlpD
VYFHFMKTILQLLFLMPSFCCAQISRDTIRSLQKARIKEDTSYIYQLPFLKSNKFRMIQGYFTNFSHKHLIANDFTMKEGTKICAARNGVVVGAYDNSNIGGMKDKENHWNYVLIMHQDSTTAVYGHLQQNGLKVKIGDSVIVGQEIALSGNTGYSAFPHLHFAVYDKNDNQIPVRFKTAKGIGYLKQWKKYSANSKKDI